MLLDELDPNTNADSDTHVLAGLHYYYRVFAFNNAGASAESNTVDLVIPQAT